MYTDNKGPIRTISIPRPYQFLNNKWCSSAYIVRVTIGILYLQKIGLLYLEVCKSTWSSATKGLGN